MGLSEEELPIVVDTKAEIAWLSINNCPTLEACKALGLDTRQVCRAVYEKSTQALFSQLDPQLRFLRSYEDIRPHSKHCREMIVRVDFEGMMAIAVEEAKASIHEGNKGFQTGGVIHCWRLLKPMNDLKYSHELQQIIICPLVNFWDHVELLVIFSHLSLCRNYGQKSNWFI